MNKKKKKLAASTIQKYWRRFNEIKKASTILQQISRSYLCKIKQKEIKKASIILQQISRSYLCRIEIEPLIENNKKKTYIDKISDLKLFSTDDLIIWIKLLDIPEKEMIIKCILDNKLTGLDINEITIKIAVKFIFVNVQEDTINILLEKRDELIYSKLIQLTFPDSPPGFFPPSPPGLLSPILPFPPLAWPPFPPGSLPPILPFSPIPLVQPKTNQCDICMEEYTDNIIPRILKCGHSFCEICLKKMSEIYGGKKINCPKCKEECRILKGDITNLPINYDLKN